MVCPIAITFYAEFVHWQVSLNSLLYVPVSLNSHLYGQTCMTCIVVIFCFHFSLLTQHFFQTSGGWSLCTINIIVVLDYRLLTGIQVLLFNLKIIFELHLGVIVRDTCYIASAVTPSWFRASAGFFFLWAHFPWQYLRYT